MTPSLTDLKNTATRNLDAKVVVSSMAGAALLGVVAFAMHKSNIKALKQVAAVATGKAK